MPNAVVRDFPPDTMQPGDVFLMNDTYLSEGSIGHLPDLCSTVPVFHGGEVVAYIQAFGHHDDIGGRVPGSMPGTAATVFEEGLAVPPIKLYSAGVRNHAVFTIVKRSTRVPEQPRQPISTARYRPARRAPGAWRSCSSGSEMPRWWKPAFRPSSTIRRDIFRR